LPQPPSVIAAICRWRTSSWRTARAPKPPSPRPPCLTATSAPSPAPSPGRSRASPRRTRTSRRTCVRAPRSSPASPTLSNGTRWSTDRAGVPGRIHAEPGNAPNHGVNPVGDLWRDIADKSPTVRPARCHGADNDPASHRLEPEFASGSASRSAPGFGPGFGNHRRVQGAVGGVRGAAGSVVLRLTPHEDAQHAGDLDVAPARRQCLSSVACSRPGE
jgi:hypothetical protein